MSWEKHPVWENPSKMWQLANIFQWNSSWDVAAEFQPPELLQTPRNSIWRMSLTGEDQYSGVLWFSSIIAPDFAFYWRCRFCWSNPQLELVSRCLIFSLIKKKIGKHCKENVTLMLSGQLQINWYHTCRFLWFISLLSLTIICVANVNWVQLNGKAFPFQGITEG